ncbi:O-acetylserine/cysteine efflux transporter [Paraoerskovia marina]|uniref:O-acetylserine/cysteine efflux transporter n=1 Tax=Paraoerskovia marina TaxID=545619 RepID=A0A1H1W8R2_9CELL|nr:EamA family transporter [Paraoerskovia marina]SDS92559.1 O-acetylserine/cysteine efflux transporter [Paraoerskovia marina]
MPSRHIALALLVVAIWGSNFVVIDIGVADVPPTVLLAVRFVVVLFPALLLVPRPVVPWRDVVAVGAFMSLGQFSLLYTALALGMPAGLASLVLQAQVVLTVVAAALTLRERPNGRQLAGVLIGAVGLGVVALGRTEATPALGLLLVVAAATSWAIGNVAARRAASRATSTPTATGGLSMTVWSATVVPVPLFALAMLTEGPAAVADAVMHPTAAAVLSTLYTAWLATLVGYGIWNTLLARYPASAVVPFAMLVPVVGTTVGWLVQGEVPGLWEITGGVVLLLGVAVTTLRRGRPRRARPGGRTAFPAGTGARPPGRQQT